MSPSQKPTVMFVHGAWHRPKHFERVSKLLNEQGFPTSLTANASVGGPRTANLYDDAKVVRTELDKLVVEEQKEVIVVLHSYGGIVGTQAVDVSLSRRVRKADGLAGGVLQLVYMSAFLLPLGKSPVTPVDGDVPAAFGAKDGYMAPPPAENMFYGDLSAEDQTYFISVLQNQTSASFVTPLTYTAWKDHPVSYIYCTEDQAIPLAKQHSMVAESGIESEVATFEVDSSHSPFLSKPQEIVDIIKKVTEQIESSRV